MASRPPRVLLYADFRLSHSLEWLRGLRASGINVCAASSEMLSLRSSDIHQTPDPITRLRHRLTKSGANTAIRNRVNPASEAAARWDKLQITETILTPLKFPSHKRMLTGLAAEFKPDVLHALRIPYEGLVASHASIKAPLVVSSWGQDFRRQAKHDPLLGAWMRSAMPQVAGLLSDTPVDISAARSYGLRLGAPTAVFAGNFGVDEALFHPSRKSSSAIKTVVYPRGLRDYVDHSIFLRLCERFSGRHDLSFIGVGLNSDRSAQEFAARCPNLRLTGELERTAFAAVMRDADIVVSPARSDGTPNSVIEALACGSQVLAGDTPSIQHLAQETPRVRLIPLDEPIDSWVSAVDLLLSTGRGTQPSRAPFIPQGASRPQNVDRILDFYREVLASS